MVRDVTMTMRRRGEVGEEKRARKIQARPVAGYLQIQERASLVLPGRSPHLVPEWRCAIDAQTEGAVYVTKTC